MIRFLPILVVAILCTQAFCLRASETSDGSTVGTTASSGEYAKHDEGWFFYKDPRFVEKKPEEPPPSLPKEAGAAVAKPPVGSVAWIRENIDKIRDRAIDNPTPENIELFGYVQKLMMDKSEIFASRMVASNATNPALDESISNPRSAVALGGMYKAKSDAMEELLKKLSQEVAIWYFFRSDCPYCAKEDPVLQWYQQKYGYSILPISTDGAPLADNSFPDWVPDQGQAEKLSVTATPTLYLVHPPSDVVLLGIGVQSSGEINERIIEVAHNEKWISDKEYNAAMKGLPRRYLTDGFDPSTVSDPDNTQALLEAFRASGIYGERNANLQDLESAGGATPIRRQ